MTSQSPGLFVEVGCPVCGERDAKVLRDANYPENASLAELQSAYRASSDHVLLDRVVKCSRCHMVYLSPQLDARLIEGGYEAVEDPVFVAQNPQRIRTFSRSIRSILKQTGLNPKGKRLLDIGCAGGAFLVAAREAGFEVQGVEPSIWLSDYGRKEYQLDIQQGILRPGMFSENSFDVISYWDVIEHISDPKEALALVRSLLKPDGYLWVNYPDIGSLVAKALGWRWPFWLSVHLNYYDRETMSRQLTEAGFSVLSIRPHWQELQLGYILQRAGQLVPPFKILEKTVEAIGLGKMPFNYWMGQTMVLARVLAGKAAR